MQLITSVPPRLSRLNGEGHDVGPQHQLRCIESWRANGFDVASVNRPDEEVPAPVKVERMSRRESGYYHNRYGPPLGAAFSVARKTRIAITNADIYLSRLDGGAGALEDMTDDAFVFGQRVEARSLDDPAGYMYLLGVDLVAFDVGRYPALVNDPGLRRFQFGCPWWDYVVPIAASFFGPVKRLAPPLLFHHAHEARWLREDQAAMCKAAYKVLTRLARQAGTPLARDFLARARETQGVEHAFSLLCIEWLFMSDIIENVAPPIDINDPVVRKWFIAISRQQAAAVVPPPREAPVMALVAPRLPNPPRLGDAWAAARADMTMALRWSGRVMERAVRPYVHKLRRAVG